MRNAIDSGNHVGTGLRTSRLVNGVPTIITDKQLNLRMDALVNRDIEQLRALRQQYRRTLDEVIAQNPKNTTVIKHYKALIVSVNRVIGEG